MDLPKLSAALLVGLALTVLAPKALAEGAYFSTPSKNIHCAYDDFEGTPYVRCDISNFTPAAAKRPADCDLEWGDSFAIGANDREGYTLCHGDTVISTEARTLDYGHNFKRGGITCASETSGLTCKNGKGHGFFISKAKQRVF